MNKICIIFTGGTIGMVRDDKGTLRPPRSPNSFLTEVAPELGEIVGIDFFVLMNVDSTNIVPAHWTLMAKAVYARRNEGYKEFVIVHGTDTMHFSASAMAFALGPQLNFPVVFTGAQTTPDVQHGDARINLIRAAKVAQEDIAEVVISFSDYVYRACRTQKKDERRFDAFESPALYPIADITGSILIHPGARKLNHNEAGDIDLRPDFAEGILQVNLIPGLKPAMLTPASRARKMSGNRLTIIRRR